MAVDSDGLLKDTATYILETYAMTQFLGDIAFLLELFAVSGGLLLLGRANGSSDSAIHSRIAAWLLLLGGGLSALCTGYYYLSYWTQGAFKNALLVTTAAELTLV